MACLLMSRVSSWATKVRLPSPAADEMGLTRARLLGWPAQHKAISAFFELCPTPSSFMEASARPETILAAIKPLGLFDQRMIGLVAVSQTTKPPLTC